MISIPANWLNRKFHFEQAVYGSFSFWQRGYAILGRSAGCQDDWLHALRLVSQRLGEPPAGTTHQPSLLALPIRNGPWMIVGVFPQGLDDQGRPGALAFHSLFVGRWAYRLAGSSPFVFIPALRGDWTSQDQNRELPSGSLTVASGQRHETLPTSAVTESVRMAADALKRGQRVVIFADAPTNEFTQQVWKRLSGRVRRRTSVATWAFLNENQFDLVTMPRGIRANLDGGELCLSLESTNPRAPGSQNPGFLASC